MVALAQSIRGWLVGCLTVLLGLGDDLISIVSGDIGQQPRFRRTDSGNAELFAHLHGNKVRFDHKRGRWLVWDEALRRWSEDKQAQVRLLMKDTARYRLSQALKTMSEDSTEGAFALRSENRKQIESALELAKSEPPVRLIPFTQAFNGANADPNLLERLKSEASGILNWAIEGCLLWQAEGLEVPEAVAAATGEYREESDVLAEFLNECCTVDAADWVTSADLWDRYRWWTYASGTKPLSRGQFASHLKRRGFERAEKGHNKISVWQGLRVAANAGLRALAGAKS